MDSDAFSPEREGLPTPRVSINLAAPQIVLPNATEEVTVPDDVLIAAVRKAILTSKEILQWAHMPWFGSVVKAHGGYIVKFKVSSPPSALPRANSDEGGTQASNAAAPAAPSYRLSFIADVLEESDPYEVSRNNRQHLYNVSLKLMGLNNHVRVDAISSRAVTDDEALNFALTCIPNKQEFVANATKLVENWKTHMVDRVLTAEEGQALIKSNSKLQRARVNDVLVITQLEKQLRDRAQIKIQHQNRNSPPPDTSQNLSQQLTQMTQYLTPLVTAPVGRSFSSPDLSSQGRDFSSPTRDGPPPEVGILAAKIDCFTEYIKDPNRIAAERHRRVLTEKNRDRNEIRTLRSIENHEKYARPPKFTELASLWEVDDTRRAQLCREYEEDKERRENDEDDGKKKKKDDAKKKEVLNEEEVFKRQASLHASRRLNPLEVIPEDIFAVGSPEGPAGGRPSAGRISTGPPGSPLTPLPPAQAIQMLRTPTRIPSNAGPASSKKRERDFSSEGDGGDSSFTSSAMMAK